MDLGLDEGAIFEIEQHSLEIQDDTSSSCSRKTKRTQASPVLERRREHKRPGYGLRLSHMSTFMNVITFR